MIGFFRFTIILSLFSLGFTGCLAEHLHSERAYQQAWAKKHQGIEEFVNDDRTRVDVVTRSHAVEFDFATKWAESVGQALYYHLKTGKRGKVVLILEKPKEEQRYLNRVKKLSQKYDFDVEYVTPAILNIKNGKCSYSKCKCHKAKSTKRKKGR